MCLFQYASVIREYIGQNLFSKNTDAEHSQEKAKNPDLSVDEAAVV